MSEFPAFVAAVDALLALPLEEQRRYLESRFGPTTGRTEQTPLLLNWQSPGRTTERARTDGYTSDAEQ